MKPTVVVAGYLSLDRIICPAGTFTDVPGGGALYAALGAARAGAAVHLAARVSTDFPAWIVQSLQELGVGLADGKLVPGTTRRAELVDVDAGAGRASARLSPNHKQTIWWERTSALAPQTCGLPADAYVVTAMPAATAKLHIAAGREHGAVVVMDTSEAFAAREAAEVLALLAEVDAFAPSVEEVRLLFTELNDSEGHTALARLSPTVLEKRGHKGCWLSTPRSSRQTIPSVAENVVDSTGAGDACVGAFAAALAAGHPASDAAKLATVIAAQALAGVGPSGLGVAMPEERVG